jgi:hypothetical protein
MITTLQGDESFLSRRRQISRQGWSAGALDHEVTELLEGRPGRAGW